MPGISDENSIRKNALSCGYKIDVRKIELDSEVTCFLFDWSGYWSLELCDVGLKMSDCSEATMASSIPCPSTISINFWRDHPLKSLEILSISISSTMLIS